MSKHIMQEYYRAQFIVSSVNFEIRNLFHRSLFFEAESLIWKIQHWLKEVKVQVQSL